MDELAQARIDLLSHRLDKALMDIDRLNTRLTAVEDTLAGEHA